MNGLCQDWNPVAYAEFRGLRLRPAMDLLAQVPELPPGEIVDFGCGDGAVGPALAKRFPARRPIGVDKSPTMLEIAAAGGIHDALVRLDAFTWAPTTPIALIYSNAVCHWMPDHQGHFRHLAAMPVPLGVLAVQMPRQQMAASHRLLRDMAAQMFPDLFDFSTWTSQVAEPGFYRNLLATVGDLDLWESEYHQKLAARDTGHPIRHFTQSTAMRPISERLTEKQQEAFVARYDAALSDACPLDADGSAYLRFRRLFFVLSVT